MIKRKVTILFMDDKKMVYECVRYPWTEGPFFILPISEENCIYIPTSQIQRMLITDIWKKEKRGRVVDNWPL
jgi:hypothetical protein